MLCLLAVSLILCFFSISGEVWVEKLLPKMRNEFVVTSFGLKFFENIAHGVMSVL